ncbi:hypothetical protein DPMN_086691 [Dreissena polymorpha]|uniref:Uncharacterized protein n=1 Tax=Dreissena polymorpha TaxID=45954 RepID=A0A9D4KQW6_DREPO|nr:hypothetical protein DPMN_086691 [Dreissena polymorpha]
MLNVLGEPFWGSGKGGAAREEWGGGVCQLLALPWRRNLVLSKATRKTLSLVSLSCLTVHIEVSLATVPWSILIKDFFGEYPGSRGKFTYFGSNKMLSPERSQGQVRT